MVSATLKEQERINQIKVMLQSIVTASNELPKLNIEEVCKKAFDEIDELLEELRSNGIKKPGTPLEKAVRLCGIVDLALSRPYTAEFIERTNFCLRSNLTNFLGRTVDDECGRMVIKKGGLYIITLHIREVKANSAVLQDIWDTNPKEIGFTNKKDIRNFSEYSPQQMLRLIKENFIRQIK